MVHTQKIDYNIIINTTTTNTNNRNTHCILSFVFIHKIDHL